MTRKMQQVWVCLALLLWPTTSSQQVPPPPVPRTGAVTVVEAVAGGRALLPCDLEAPSPDHPVTQVDFLRKYNAFTSIYRIHAHGGSLARASHWVPDGYLDRAFVETAAREDRGLILDDVRLQDEAEYRCRVEYREAPASVSLISLKVVVVPKTMIIFSDDPKNEVAEVAGPYSTGERVSLSCQVTGGHPRPRVTWWEGSLLLDDVSEHESGEVTRNDITLEPLTRADLHRRLTCRASNANITEPMSSSVTLDLHYPPTSVAMVWDVNGEVEVLADEPHSLYCRVQGSRPPPVVTFRLNGVQLHTEHTMVDEEVVSASTTLTARPDQDGSELTCSAFNPELPHTTITDSTRLAVLYAPQVELRRGLNLNFDDIQEGDDVLFSCNVKASPPATDVEWLHDGQVLLTDRTAGVHVSPSTLVLQEVTREASGQYKCNASNPVGASTSNTLHLQVKFAPVCAEGKEVVIPATAHVQVVIPCLVDAHPPPTSFRWTMNTSAGEVEVPTSQYHWVGMRSELLHTPPADHHYRRLRCWAANQVDRQRNPCEFFVVPAPKPVAVSGCSVGEPDTAEAPLVSVEVSCVAGEDGGLSQTFTLQVQDPDNVTKVQHKNQPVFTVERLRVGVSYLLTVTVASAQGASPPYTFSVFLNDTTEASSAVNDTTEASSSAVNDTTEASSSAGQVAPPDPSNWFLLVLFMVVAWTAVQACPCFLLGGVLLWMYLRRRPPRNHPHPHALTNGDPTREVLLKPPTSNGFVRSPPPVNHIDVYLERERNRFLSMGNAPRASLDSLELSTAPPSVYSDPLRSLQPSPFSVDPGPEKLAVGGEEKTGNSGRETSILAGTEGVALLAAEGVGDTTTRGAVETTDFEGGAAGTGAAPATAPLRIPPLETSLDDDV